MSDIIYTYTPDMNRPHCPICGNYVKQDTDTPEIPWEGLCPKGHTNTFQLDIEVNDEEDE